MRERRKETVRRIEAPGFGNRRVFALGELVSKYKTLTMSSSRGLTCRGHALFAVGWEAHLIPLVEYSPFYDSGLGGRGRGGGRGTKYNLP